MTPEPKAPAFDLDAAVEAATLLSSLRHVAKTWPELKAVGAVALRAADRIEALEAALSSQSQAAEGMAIALSEVVPDNIADNPNIENSRVIPCDVTMGEVRRARAALSHYRTLGEQG